MKKVDFKIIELPERQVLVAKDWEDEEDGTVPAIKVSMFINGTKCTQTLGYADEEERDKAFAEISEEAASKLEQMNKEVFEG